MPQVVIPYEPQPRQVLFHQTSEVDELLYGGAAGGGKSEATIWDALYYGLTYPASRQIIFRRKFPDLERSIIARTQLVYPKELATYNASKYTWTLVNGSVIELAHWDHDSDYLKYQGAEYDVVRWEELTQFKESWYTLMLSRIRGTNPYPRCVKSTTNPGQEGHVWVKKRFIDVGPWEQVHTIHEHDEEGNAMYYPANHPKAGQPIITRRIFIPAKVSDNQKLIENDPDYVARLMRLPIKDRKQLLDGDWDTFSGQFFEEWDRAMHVVKPFKVPADWRRFRMMDEGYNDPFVCLWGALDYEGNMYIYREAIKTKLLSSDQAEWVRKLTGKERIAYTVGDTSFWNKGKADGKAPFEVFQEYGIPMIQATKERVNGWKRIREWLKVYDETDPVSGNKYQTSKLKIFDNCTGLIEALPAMIRDEHNPEDVAEHPLDHAPDALRYGLMSRPAPSTRDRIEKPLPFPFRTEEAYQGGFQQW